MARKIEIVPYRRKEKTNYRKRLRQLLAKKPRFVIRKTIKYLYIQAVKYGKEGDRVMFTISSKNLSKLGWQGGEKNLPSAYLTGLLAGKRAKELGLKNGILDLGLQPAIKGSRVFAALKGLLDSGIEIPHSKEILPSEDRLGGKHIAKYSQMQKPFLEMKNKLMVI